MGLSFLSSFSIAPKVEFAGLSVGVEMKGEARAKRETTLRIYVFDDRDRSRESTCQEQDDFAFVATFAYTSALAEHLLLSLKRNVLPGHHFLVLRSVFWRNGHTQQLGFRIEQQIQPRSRRRNGALTVRSRLAPFPRLQFMPHHESTHFMAHLEFGRKRQASFSIHI